MLLAGCAEAPGLADYAKFTDLAPALAPAFAPVRDDPSFRLSQLKGGMNKSELDAIYGKRLVRTDGDATFDLYTVESASAWQPNGAREKLALWVVKDRLATWGIVETKAAIPVAPIVNALPPAPGQIPASAVHGRYGVQIAARPTQDAARDVINDMRGKYAGLLGREWAVIYRVDLPQGPFYRAVVGPFASESQANRLCAALKAKGEACFLRQG
jgi:hypothetical protein